MSELHCIVENEDYEGPTQWRWRLSEPGGRILAEHQVRLNTTDWEYRAFTDLAGYLDGHVAPDQAVEQETAIVAALGRWIAADVFGPIALAMARARPATVRVVVPIAARELLYLPLELAHIDGRPLSVEGVTLVLQSDEKPPADVDAVTDCLRVLGVFSLPADERPLHLRRERQNLVRVFDDIAATGRAVELRVVQYGVTRKRLGAILAEHAWDIVHLAGHGKPGSLALEGDNGSAEPVGAAELVKLLSGTTPPPKLVVISACHSAARSNEPEQPAPASLIPATAGPEPAVTDLATELARKLHCAVLAMRYSVVDDFAILLAGQLYPKLASESRTLAEALGQAMGSVLDGPPTEHCPASSAATPALFGARATGLRLTAPRHTAPGPGRVPDRRLPGFDSQPEHFVGRLMAIARAREALIEPSGKPAVLLYGMPGIGKSACALEFAYTYRDDFDSLVWCTMPDDPRLATPTMPVQPGTTLSDLAGQLRSKRVLLVLDNLGPLLDDTGRWLDPRWGEVISTLTNHDGPGRMIMTSRTRPETLAPDVRVLTIDALSPAETGQLIWDLPNLRRLGHGAVTRVLRLVQGHPGLLQQANDQAADPDQLGVLLDAVDKAWHQVGGVPDERGTRGRAVTTGEDYRHVMHTWIRTAVDALPPSARELFILLSCLYEYDRISLVLKLVRPESQLDIECLEEHGLLSVQPGKENEPDVYRLLPAMAEVGRNLTDAAFQASVDRRLAHDWAGLFNEFLSNDRRAEASWLVVHSAVSAARYLVRLGQLEHAAGMLEQALVRDHSPACLAEVRPMIDVITAAPGADRQPAVLHLRARALETTEPDNAEQLMRNALELARQQRNHKSAALAASALSSYCKCTGRITQALRFANDRIAFTEQAGLGPWSQLAAQVQRLDISATMAHPQEVYGEALRLLNRMDGLPERPTEPDSAKPFRVRESLLHTGFEAAVRLEQWQEALNLADRLEDAKKRRDAPVNEIAGVWCDQHAPLLYLGRHDEARSSLLAAKRVFEEADDAYGLGLVFGALAGIENHLGNGDGALSLGQNSLRYAYRAGDPQAIQTAHHSLGTYLAWYNQDNAGLAHLLAAALICTLLADRRAAESLGAIGYFAADINPPHLPTNLAGLCERVAEGPDVDLQSLLLQLNPDSGAHTQLFTRLRADAEAQLSA